MGFVVVSAVYVATHSLMLPRPACVVPQTERKISQKFVGDIAGDESIVDVHVGNAAPESDAAASAPPQPATDAINDDIASETSSVFMWRILARDVANRSCGKPSHAGARAPAIKRAASCAARARRAAHPP